MRALPIGEAAARAEAPAEERQALAKRIETALGEYPNIASLLQGGVVPMVGALLAAAAAVIAAIITAVGD